MLIAGKCQAREQTQDRGGFASLGVVLSVLAVLLQLLLALSVPQSALARTIPGGDGLFPAVCGFHDPSGTADAAGNTPFLPESGQDCSSCPLCRLSAGDAMLPTVPQPLAGPSEWPPVRWGGAVPVESHADGRDHAPPPSRGPPFSV